MCQGCNDLMLKYYPHLSDADKGHLLMNCTCFPFGGPDLIEKQLIELKANTDGSLNEAMAYAESQMDKQLAEHMGASKP